MTDPDQKRQLDELDAKIRAAKSQANPSARAEDHHHQTEAGWRMVIELVSGLLIGFGIGYGLDSLFGTMPLFLVVFILLGFVAGVRTMMRTAQDIQRKAEAAQAAAKDGED